MPVSCYATGTGLRYLLRCICDSPFDSIVCKRFTSCIKNITSREAQILLTEQSALDDCTHPESSFLIQQAVSLSLLAEAAMALAILASRRMHGANLAPKCMRSAARGPNQNEAGSSHST